ncbi:MAG: M14 family metallopeptidase, partial [Clostridium sp.]|nr:M14 family metallopeptidase [Clostridium sp.]
DNFRITGYKFGKGNKSVCIIGAMRGNEVQQLYTCSQLINELKKLEKKGAITRNNEILIIPCINTYGMNIGKRFCTTDNVDINRMFSETEYVGTSRKIAEGIFEKVQGYTYGIQFASFYMPGDFIPHVRMMETGYQSPSLANLFGLQYVLIRKPKPFDTTTLNYNWQLWNTNAFSVYTNCTDEIDEVSARHAVTAVLRFLTRMGVIKYNCHSGYIASIIEEDNLKPIMAKSAGIFRRKVNPGDCVERGDILAEVLDPYEGLVLSNVVSTTNGIVFFAHNAPLVIENSVVFKIIRRIHD